MKKWPAFVMTSVLSLAVFTGASSNADSGVPSPAISCVIRGETRQFGAQTRALPDGDHGLLITASAGPGGAQIEIALPAVKAGKFSLETTPGLKLYYARFLSSKTSDHFDAGRERPGSSLVVTIAKLGPVGERVEGTFVASVRNLDGDGIEITEGKFSVPRLPAPTGEAPSAPIGLGIVAEK